MIMIIIIMIIVTPLVINTHNYYDQPGLGDGGWDHGPRDNTPSPPSQCLPIKSP